MRVLVVSKFGYLRGGLERVMFDEIDWLRNAGHDAEFLAGADSRNEPSSLSGLFPAVHDYGAAGRASVGAVRDMFWNKRAASAMSDALTQFRPDIVHCHGIYRHMSPSILRAAQDAAVPVIMTAHDYFLVCPGNVLLRAGSVPCSPRACGRRTFGGAIRHRCVQQSLPRSVLGASELSYQRVLGRYERMLHTVICPSQFMADALAEGGVAGPHLVVVPNAVMARPSIADRSGAGPFVVVGRLSPEKGVSVALESEIGRAHV